MDYLAICKLIKKDQTGYTGLISPKAYSRWQKTFPTILFFEGVHQFAVKSVRSLQLEAAENQKWLPVQLKNISIIQETGYEDIFIKGCLVAQDNLCLVKFKTYLSPSDADHDVNHSTSGTVYVSRLLMEK